MPFHGIGIQGHHEKNKKNSPGAQIHEFSGDYRVRNSMSRAAKQVIWKSRFNLFSPEGQKGRCSMKWFNDYRMRFVLVGFVAAIVLGGETAKADFVLGEPVNLGPPVNNSASDGGACISSDRLELYFSSDRPGSLGSHDIWVAKRASVSGSWEPPMNPGLPLNNSGGRNFPTGLSSDDLELYFVSYNRSGGYGSYDIWVARRETRDHDWEQPTNLGPTVNRSSYDDGAWISHDGLELYFMSDRPGGIGSFDIWVSKRATKNDPWTEPINLGAIVNSAARDAYPCLSTNGLVLFLSGLDMRAPYRPGGFGGSDMWMTTRPTVSDPWDTPVNLGSIVNSSSHEESPRLSSDGSTLYFNSNRPGGYGGQWGDIWQAAIIPIVDFNGDHKVDSADMHIMVDHWGENYPLCDIGPTPLGDGIVDIQDMIVLAEHLYRLTAHWKLDETDGTIAYDSFGDYDGTLNGNPFWQPTGGMIGGTLLFDGVDDYVSTPFILYPSKGSLSVFAWIYGWTPGQVIISQSNTTGARGAIPGSTWLGIDPTEGTLMTGFSDQYFGSLESESVITDMQWHHVGFVYDMDSLHRRLYVDGVLVAEDTSAVSGVPSDSGLNIGASKDLDPTSLFSGFIDDVRMYNQALSAEEIATLAQ